MRHWTNTGDAILDGSGGCVASHRQAVTLRQGPHSRNLMELVAECTSAVVGSHPGTRYNRTRRRKYIFFVERRSRASAIVRAEGFFLIQSKCRS